MRIALRCRGSRGLTTLEWLLVVAAVAGIAAVAVVLVSYTVDSTAEHVATHSPRQEAAELATAEVEDRWRREQPASQQQADRLNRNYVTRCRRIETLYGDIDLGVFAKPGLYEDGTLGWSDKRLPICTLV